MGLDDTKEKRHPSWVTVQFSRISGSRTFFGSSVESTSWIRLYVSEAERYNSAGQDRIQGGLGNRILEVDLSPAQFAELLTTMNVGTGVPGTMVEFNGKRIPRYEETKTEAMKVKEFFKTMMHERAGDFEEALKQMKAVMGKDKISKQDRLQAIKLMESMVQHLKSNTPFYIDQFNESAGKIVSQAKAEVEAFVTHAVTSTGLDVLRGKSAPTMIGSSDGKGTDE